MKSEFLASVIACIATFVTVLIVWFLFGKPSSTDDNATAMIGCLAIIALCNSFRNELSKKEE